MRDRRRGGDLLGRGLQRVCMIGASFRTLGFERLSALVLPADDAGGLRELRSILGAREAVYLATCNRVELYLTLERDATRDLPRRVASWFAARAGGELSEPVLEMKVGTAAVEHLFRVASSLESLAVGECEIAGQVRRAVDRAKAAGCLGERLRRLFRRAALVAKRVRSETGVGRTPVSVASLAGHAIRDHFRGGSIDCAVLVGVGDMTKKVARTLVGRTDVWVVNRTYDRAVELAETVGARPMSLRDFRAAPPDRLDVLVTATAAEAPIIGAAELAPALRGRARRGRPDLLVCDLGLPPDVDPAVGSCVGVRRISLVDLEVAAGRNQARLAGEVSKASAIVADEAARFSRRYALCMEAEDAAACLLGGPLQHLAAADQKVLERFALRLADRLVQMGGLADLAA